MVHNATASDASICVGCSRNHRIEHNFIFTKCVCCFFCVLWTIGFTLMQGIYTCIIIIVRYKKPLGVIKNILLLLYMLRLSWPCTLHGRTSSMCFLLFIALSKASTIELRAGLPPAAHWRRWDIRNWWLLILSCTAVSEADSWLESTCTGQMSYTCTGK